MPFAGQHVYVMGGTHGIGEAVARAFAAAGARVVITGRSKERLDAAAGRIGHPAETRVLGATDPRAGAGFLGEPETVDPLGLALGPGAVPLGPLVNVPEPDLHTAFDGKFFAHVRILQAAAPHRSKSASLTFISAASARSASPGTAGLAAANGAIEAMVPPAAAELAPIRVNAVSPGVIETPWWAGLPEDQRAALFEDYATGTPVGRIGQSEHVAEAILYLAANGFVTGTVLDEAVGLTLARG